VGKNLFQILEENGINLTQSGERWVARCPFHEGDRSPSFTIYPNETYFCFGCRSWGDAVKFLVEYKHMPPDAAMDYVGQEYRTKKQKHVIKVRDTAKVWPFLYDVAERYHQNLLNTPGAWTYLKTRGLSDATIFKYKIGYTDGSVLDIQNSLEYSLAVEYGVINSNGYELLSHRITIPNIPKEGLCDFIIGRTVTHDRIKYLGIKTPKPIMGLHDAWISPVLFIVEGQFDWLLLREWGFPSIAIGGTHVTSTNLMILKQRNVVIVPDNDAAGISAALSLKTKLGTKSIVLDYTSMGIKDIGEVGLKADAQKEFTKLVKEQVPWVSNTSSLILAGLFPVFSVVKALVLT